MTCLYLNNQKKLWSVFFLINKKENGCDSIKYTHTCLCLFITPFDHSGTHPLSYNMDVVGFEPTKAMPVDLKSKTIIAVKQV